MPEDTADVKRSSGRYVLSARAIGLLKRTRLIIVILQFKFKVQNVLCV